MENLNTVPSTGTFGNSVQKINSNFDLIVNAINSLEYQTTRSKGIKNNGFVPSTTTLPNAVSGDWCMVLGTDNTFPARIWSFNGTTWTQGGEWNPGGIDLTQYAKTSDMNAAIAQAISQVEIETVDNLNEETAASGKALDAHQGFVLAGQIENVQDALDKLVGETRHETAINLSTYESDGLFIAGNGSWSGSANWTGFFVPVTAGHHYKIESDGVSKCAYAFMTSTSATSGSPVTTFAEGYTSTSSVAVGKCIIAIAPSDAQYLWVSRKLNTVIATPNIYEVEIAKESVKYIEGKVTKTDSLANGTFTFPSDGYKTIISLKDLSYKKLHIVITGVAISLQPGNSTDIAIYVGGKSIYKNATHTWKNIDIWVNTEGESTLSIGGNHKSGSKMSVRVDGYGFYDFEQIDKNVYMESVFEGSLEAAATKRPLIYTPIGFEVGKKYRIGITFAQTLVANADVILYSQGTSSSEYITIETLLGGNTHYVFDYIPSENSNNQYIGIYNFNDFTISASIVVEKKGNISEKIIEVEAEANAYGEHEVGETVQLPVYRKKGTTWKSDGTRITERRIEEQNNYTTLDAIDVTGYDKVMIKFYLSDLQNAVTVFTDDEGVFVGSKKIQTNASAGYITYKVPEGATKLYVTSKTAEISEIGVKVEKNKELLSEKVSERCNTLSNMYNMANNVFIDYRFDAATGSYFTVIRIHKLMIDGTYQYPHIFAPYRNQPRQMSTLTMNKQFGFAVAINAGIFDVTSGSPTIGCPRGTLVVNGEVIQQQEEEDTGRKYRFLTINNNGDLGWKAQTVTGAEMIAQGIVDAIAGWEPFIDNYVPIETYCGTGPDDTAQRQIIGQFGNGDYAIVTCEGRDNMVSDGWTMDEMKSICVNLGLKFAYNLDGGGSTETVVGKKQLNTIYEGTEGRAVPTYIVFNGKTTL